MHSDRALALWICYNHHLFNSCRSQPNTVLTFSFLRHHPKESSQRLSHAVASMATIPNRAIEQQLEQKFVGDLLRSRTNQLLCDRASKPLRECCISLYNFCEDATKEALDSQSIANEFKAQFIANIDELNSIFPANKIAETNTNELERLRLENLRLINAMQSRTSCRRQVAKLVRSGSQWVKETLKQSR